MCSIGLKRLFPTLLPGLAVLHAALMPPSLRIFIYSDIRPIPGGFEGTIAPLDVFGNDKSRLVRVADGRTGQLNALRH
jgi:hypothetical protein